MMRALSSLRSSRFILNKWRVRKIDEEKKGREKTGEE
jgi:hypothetical protein